MAYQAFLNNRSMQQELQQQFAGITTEILLFRYIESLSFLYHSAHS